MFRVPGPPAVSPADAPHRHGARSFPQPRGRGGVGLEAAPVVAARRQSPAVRACQRRPPSAAPALGPVSSVFERGKCPTLTTRLTCRQGIALPSCSAPPAVLQTGDGSCTSPVRMLRRLGTARPTGPNGRALRGRRGAMVGPPAAAPCPKATACREAHCHPVSHVRARDRRWSQASGMGQCRPGCKRRFRHLCSLETSVPGTDVSCYLLGQVQFTSAWMQ